jgi:prophage DNA circulation protein
MTWREQMGEATFRGVPFAVSSGEQSGGRRGVTHEYPGKETAYREDLGAKAGSFSCEGFVLGDDYQAKRAALVAALGQPGPGELVHPYFGRVRVSVDGFKVREAAPDGGMAVFSMEFVVTDATPSQPTVVVDAKGAAVVTSALVKAALAAEFEAVFVPEATRLGAISAALGSAASTLGAIAGNAALETQPYASLRRQVTRLTENAAALAATPVDLAAELVALFDAMPSGVLGAYTFDPGPLPEATTPNRAQERENLKAVQRLVQRLALVRAVELALDTPFESYEAAVSARTELADLLDEQAEEAGDELYPTLVQFRADLTKAVPGEASDLPRLATYTAPSTVPSLVLTHRLYGTVAQEADVLQRNAVAHPGFVPGGVPLEVLSRD